MRYWAVLICLLSFSFAARAHESAVAELKSLNCTVNSPTASARQPAVISIPFEPKATTLDIVLSATNVETFLSQIFVEECRDSKIPGGAQLVGSLELAPNSVEKNEEFILPISLPDHSGSMQLVVTVLPTATIQQIESATITIVKAEFVKHPVVHSYGKMCFAVGFCR
jgi:hypothetical protein